MRRLLSVIPVLVLLSYGCGGDTTTNLAGAGGAAADDDAGTGGAAGMAGTGGAAGDGGSTAVAYPIVDTAQVYCYGDTAAASCPAAGEPFYGQDAQFLGSQRSYTLSADGLTVADNVTGLTWQRTPDTNGDGVILADDKFTADAALQHCQDINTSKYGGFDDWRLPSIKELYSLILFNGTDPSGLQGNDTSTVIPFIDTDYFQFAYGDTSAGERIIDAQYASTTRYVSTTMQGDETMFGVNFADGRIKGYGMTMPNGSEKAFFVQCVRGNPAYGLNAFVDNGDDTVTDAATGLMWTKGDSAVALDWQSALAWVQSKNADNYLGHDDWRMPNAKELQSILDYERSPDTTQSAAIDPIFDATSITNEGGQTDWPWYWASTTHATYTGMGGDGAYVAFGRALGWMTQTPSATCYTLMDVHGAGAQRSDPKTTAGIEVIGQACGGGTAYGHGPQGDVRRGANYVRLVRDGGTPGEVDAGPLPDASNPPLDGGPPPEDGGAGPKSCNAQSDCDTAGACPSSQGCACTQTPDGKVCVPKCSTSSDCPNPPGVTLVCGPDGLCIPG